MTMITAIRASLYHNNVFRIHTTPTNLTKEAPSKYKLTYKQKYSLTRTYVNFTLIGPPGSGKGTYASLLLQRISKIEKYTPIFASTSDILRGTKDDEVAKHQETGTLVDCDVVGRAVQNTLETLVDEKSKHEITTSIPSNIGFFLDGYPRTLEQANISEQNWPDRLQLTYAISINVPRDVCVAKIIGRRKCVQCGASVNVSDVNYGKFILPSRISDCSCNTTMHWEKRKDDTEEIAHARFDDFVAKTKPVIEYFEGQNRLIEFTPYCGVDDMHILEKLIWRKIQQT